jgi:hypothetical protein
VLLVAVGFKFVNEEWINKNLQISILEESKEERAMKRLKKEK